MESGLISFTYPSFEIEMSLCGIYKHFLINCRVSFITTAKYLIAIRTYCKQKGRITFSPNIFWFLWMTMLNYFATFRYFICQRVGYGWWGRAMAFLGKTMAFSKCRRGILLCLVPNANVAEEVEQSHQNVALCDCFPAKPLWRGGRRQRWK